jgi:hypothetical protein
MSTSAGSPAVKNRRRRDSGESLWKNRRIVTILRSRSADRRHRAVAQHQLGRDRIVEYGRRRRNRMHLSLGHGDQRVGNDDSCSG